jgi:hypothetical protein
MDWAPQVPRGEFGGCGVELPLPGSLAVAGSNSGVPACCCSCSRGWIDTNMPGGLAEREGSRILMQTCNLQLPTATRITTSSRIIHLSDLSETRLPHPRKSPDD